jgi:hypothetical protein
MLVSCGNKDIFDTNYKYTKALITYGDGQVIEVNIKQWRDYDGEQIQIISTDGDVYLVSTFNAILINEK